MTARITSRKAKRHDGAVVVTCWGCQYRILTTPRDVKRIRESHVCPE